MSIFSIWTRRKRIFNRGEVIFNHKKNSFTNSDDANHLKCKSCSRASKCKCIRCVYNNVCSFCPGSDCEYAFEENTFGVKMKGR